MLKKLTLIVVLLLALCGCSQSSKYSSFYNEAKNSNYLNNDGDGWYSSTGLMGNTNGENYYIKMSQDGVVVYLFEQNSSGEWEIKGNPYFWANTDKGDTINIISEDATDVIESYNLGNIPSDYRTSEYNEIYNNIRSACAPYVADISKYLN